MRCGECDKAIGSDSRFCRHCGAEVKASASRSPRASSGGPDVHHDPAHELAIWRGRPAWRSFYGTWMVWLALCASALYLAYHHAGAPSTLVTVAWLLVAGAGAALLVRELLIIFGLRYQRTTQRLFIRRGILTRVTDQMELLRIAVVRLRQGVVDRIVNTGDLEIFGTDETDESVTLESILAPAEVAESLRLHVRAARGKGTLAVERI
jgi:membrane protein YdbS with pleckstrin-like domain